MKRIAPILISICLVCCMWFSSVLTVYAAYNFTYGTTIQLTETSAYSLNTGSSSKKFHRFYDQDNQMVLTLQWLLDNPNYSFKLSWTGTANNFEYTRFCWSNPSGQLMYIDIPNGSVINAETFTGTKTFTVNDSAYTYDLTTDTECLSQSLIAWSHPNGGTVTAMVNTTADSGGIGGETPEGGGTTEEDDNDGLFASIKDFFTGIFDNVSEWIQNAVNAIGNFFTNALNVVGQFFDNLFNKIAEFFGRLFEPITNWFENKKQEEEAKKSFWDTIQVLLEDIIEKVKGFTLQPVLEFFSSLDMTAIGTLMEIFDFPLIKELIVAVVAVLVLMGLLGLLRTF